MGDLLRLPTRHDPLLTKRQLAAHYRVSVRTIERRIPKDAGQIIGRARYFRLSATAPYMEGQRAA